MKETNGIISAIETVTGQLRTSYVYCPVTMDFNADILKRVFRGTGLHKYTERTDSVKHNAIENRVEYYVGSDLKGWLPIIREESTW